MSTFIASLLAGVLADLISSGVKTSAKYVLSTLDLEMELRRSVDLIENRQFNIEGTIEKLVMNQELMISLLSLLIEQYQLQSRVFAENQNIVFIADSNDISCLKMIVSDGESESNEGNNLDQSDVFGDYHRYVKRMRGDD